MQQGNSKVVDYLDGLDTEDTVLFRDNNVWIVCYDIEFEPAVMDSLRFGDFTYGLYQRDHIPVVLVEFGDLLFDFEINAYDLITSSQRRDFEDYAGQACFTLVSPKTREVLAERNFCFNAHYISHLKSILQRQWKYYHNEFEVRKKIKELSEVLITYEMFRESKLYTVAAINKPVK